MHALENKIPPPAVATVFALLMWLTADWTQPLPLPAPLRWSVAALLLCVGLVFCVAGLVCFKRVQTTVNPLRPAAASFLVRSGIYHYTRNPMYLGFAMFLLAWNCYLATPWALLGVAGFVLYMNYFQIAPEERALAQLFGQEFATYVQQVRRWI